jgi:hypothetical protein
MTAAILGGVQLQHEAAQQPLSEDINTSNV